VRILFLARYEFAAPIDIDSRRHQRPDCDCYEAKANEPIGNLEVEEEEGGDVSNIIGGPVTEDVEEP